MNKEKVKTKRNKRNSLDGKYAADEELLQYNVHSLVRNFSKIVGHAHNGTYMWAT